MSGKTGLQGEDWGEGAKQQVDLEHSIALKQQSSLPTKSLYIVDFLFLRRISQERDHGQVTKFSIWVSTDKRERGWDARMDLQVHQKRDWVEVPTRQSVIGKYTEVFTVVVLDYALNVEWQHSSLRFKG